MKYLPFSSRPRVGIDIQPHTINLIQLRKTRRGIVIEQTNCFPLAEEKTRDWEANSLLLTDWTRRFGLRGMSAAVSVPAKLVRTQHLQLPLGMSNELIETEIYAQVERDFPGMSAALSVDYTVRAQPRTGYADIFFIIARLEHISQYVKCIEAAGLKLKIVDVDIYALHRLFATSLPAFNSVDEVHASLFFLRNKLVLMISDRHEIFFYHEWNRISENEEWAQIENRLQHFHATFPIKVMARLGVYTNKNELSSLLSTAKQFFSYEIFALNSEIELDEDYFLACGSVMRDMPIW